MSITTDLSLRLATRILAHRLTRPTTIGVNILDHDTGSDYSINENDGRFVGLFTIRPNGAPCFVLFARADLAGPINYMFVFYIRTNYKTVQTSEKVHYKKTLPGLFDKPPTIKSSVINIASQAPRTCDLFLLMQAVDFSIHPDLINHFRPHQVLDVHKGSSLVCLNPLIGCPDCDIRHEDQEAKQLWSDMKTLKFKVLRYDRIGLPDKIPLDYDVAVFQHKSHLIYVIHYIPVKTLMILLPHSNQFATEVDCTDFINSIRDRMVPYKPKYIGATRFYGDPGSFCSSSSTVKACMLALISGSNLMTIIKQSDVDAVISNQDLAAASSSLHQARGESQSVDMPDEDIIESPVSSQETVIYSQDSESSTIFIRVDGSDGDPEIISVGGTPVSSQETVIYSSEWLEREMWINSKRPAMQAIFKLGIPHITRYPYPQTDMTGRILNSSQYYYFELGHIADLWQAFTSVDISPPLQLDDLAQDNFMSYSRSRFHIYPLIDGTLNYLVIVDTAHKEWILVDPSNEAYKNGEKFSLVDEAIRASSPALNAMQSRAIMITSHYHSDYPRIHLLMTVHHIGRLFKYAIKLPQKVIYAERDFRAYCFLICHFLQIANHEYNYSKGLVKSNGYLKYGALRSITSPVCYQRAVIPSDQCPFCKTRGHTPSSILGRHIAMKHGNLSSDYNATRHIQYS